MKINLQAFGINAGGGLVLLKDLLLFAPLNFDYVFLDVRVKGLIDEEVVPYKVIWVKKSLFSRFVASMKLRLLSNKKSITFCFNSLPPPLKTKGFVITYVHAPHFVDMHLGISYNLKTRIRIEFERLWFSLFNANSNEFWVQTNSMKMALGKKIPLNKIRVNPFIDSDLLNIKANFSEKRKESAISSSELNFFYPAELVGHKNHVNLLRAWIFLKNDGVNAKLFLTLSSLELNRLVVSHNLEKLPLENIICLGRMSRNEVIVKMSESTALIFPSLIETLGLPLIEAQFLSVPILAPERSYVREVCVPDETFDPLDYRSIGGAVLRHLGCENTRSKLLNASEIFEQIKRSTLSNHVQQ